MTGPRKPPRPGRAHAPPSEPPFSIAIPVRQPGRGVYTKRVILGGAVSTGTIQWSFTLGLDEDEPNLHVMFSLHDGTPIGGYLIALSEVVQAIADEHERRS